METQPPSLGDQIARLRSNAQAQEKCAWLPAAIHALIMACLVRIFGRLEQILQLWHAGCLPAPPIRAISHCEPTQRQCQPAMRAPRHRPHPAARQAESAPRSRAPMAIAPSIPAPDRTAGAAPSRTIVPAARPRPARDPPAVQPAARSPIFAAALA